MPPSPFDALADALVVLADTLRDLPLSHPAATLPPAQHSSEWVTARQFSDRNTAFPYGTVARLVAAREANGLLHAGIIKDVFKRKVIIHEARMLAWLLHEPHSSRPSPGLPLLRTSRRKRLA